MKDLIDRQAAIDEIKEIYEWHDNVTKERIIEHFERLPSAQPTQTNTPNALKSLDCISRQAALDVLKRLARGQFNLSDEFIQYLAGLLDAEIEIKKLPTAEPHNFDEWCDDCKEYDNEKHCCPRFNRVIRTAMEEAKGEGNAT